MAQTFSVLLDRADLRQILAGSAARIWTSAVTVSCGATPKGYPARRFRSCQLPKTWPHGLVLHARMGILARSRPRLCKTGNARGRIYERPGWSPPGMGRERMRYAARSLAGVLVFVDERRACGILRWLINTSEVLETHRMGVA